MDNVSYPTLSKNPKQVKIINIYSAVCKNIFTTYRAESWVRISQTIPTISSSFAYRHLVDGFKAWNVDPKLAVHVSCVQDWINRVAVRLPNWKSVNVHASDEGVPKGG